MRDRSPSSSSSSSEGWGSSGTDSSGTSSSDDEPDRRRKRSRGERRRLAGGKARETEAREPQPKNRKSDPVAWLGLIFLILLFPAAWFVYKTYVGSDATSPAALATSTGSNDLSSGEKIGGSSSSPGTPKSGTATGSNKTSAQTSSATATASSTSSSDTASCFPLGAASFPSSGAPSLSRADWWCSDDLLYGFLGFSYPLEVESCSDPSNGLEMITKDLRRMKDEFGATMVRVYGVECRDVTIWENLVSACKEVGLGLIVLVWWGFGSDPEGAAAKTSKSIEALFTTSELADVAPYIVHSASFGSEPIGDGVGGGGDKFVHMLKDFRTIMQGFEIPVGISEDWNRESLRQGGGLASLGADIVANTDIVHAHIMPYYQPTTVVGAEDAWAYIKTEVEWIVKAIPDQPRQLTESQWASEKGWHGRGGHEEAISLDSFKTYWNAFLGQCEWFKERKMGWASGW